MNGGRYEIPHCYKPLGFERIINYLLHYFSDAGECDYGQTTYLRMVNDLEEKLPPCQ